FDDPSGTPLKADVLVYGRLIVAGAAGQRITITSESAVPSPSEWGTIHLFPTSSDTTSVTWSSISGWSGLVIDSVSPRVQSDSLGAAADTTLRFVGSGVYVSTCTVGVGAGGVGCAVENGAPI